MLKQDLSYKRYQSAEELRSGLENIEKSIPTTDRTATHKRPLTSKERTVTFRAKRLWVPAFIIIVIIVVGLFLWHPWSGSKSPAFLSPNYPPQDRARRVLLTAGTEFGLRSAPAFSFLILRQRTLTILAAFRSTFFAISCRCPWILALSRSWPVS